MVAHEKDILNPRKRLEPDREQYVRKVTWAGFAVNLLLSGLKFGAGYFGRSQALVADAIHSLTDTTTDLAVIAGSHYWSRPPDECHPYGHRRLETLVTVFIGLMLAAAGAGIGWHVFQACPQSRVHRRVGSHWARPWPRLRPRRFFTAGQRRPGKKLRARPWQPMPGITAPMPSVRCRCSLPSAEPWRIHRGHFWI